MFILICTHATSKSDCLATEGPNQRVARVARTETCPFSASPEFLNRVFVLRLPEALSQQHAPSFQLQCNLFAAPNMLTPSGAADAGCGKGGEACKRRGGVVREVWKGRGGVVGEGRGAGRGRGSSG
eukprot:366535-Chlamydomonas_euryale.AAC.5